MPSERYAYLSIYLSSHLSIHPSIDRSIYLSIYVWAIHTSDMSAVKQKSIYLPIIREERTAHTSIVLSIYLSIYLFKGHSHLGHERCEAEKRIRLDGRPCRASKLKTSLRLRLRRSTLRLHLRLRACMR